LKYLFILLALVPSFFLNADERQTQAPLQTTSQAPLQATLKVSTSNVMPWGIEKEDGKHQGLLVELAREFSDVLQEPISNRLRPYPRVLVDIEHGSSDLAVLFTSPHSKNIGHPLGLVIEAAVIAVSKKNHSVITSLDELGNERVAYVRGSKYGPAFDNHPTLNKTPVKDMNQGLRMLMRNHVDVVISADQSIFYSIDNLGVDPSKLKLIYQLATAKADLYLSKNSPHVGRIEEFKAAAQRLKSKKVLDRIFYHRDYISREYLNHESRPIRDDMEAILFGNGLSLASLR